MDRLSVFKALRSHPYLGKARAKLTKEEEQTAEAFIVESDHLDRSGFELLVNRMFLDKPKPQHWVIMMEMLLCCNTAVDR